MKIEFCLNGEDVTVDCPPLARALDVLRKQLKLTATKEGCGEGECGSCSILVNDQVVNACLLPAVQLTDCQVETLESVMRPDGKLSDLQQAMVTSDGAQCGICTPGMIMAGTAYLRQLVRQGGTCQTEDVRHAIAGNLCRCTGYGKIIDAIMMVAPKIDEGWRS